MELRLNLHRLAAIAICFAFLASSTGAQRAPDQSAPAPAPQSDLERAHAHELFMSGKFVEAMPLLEKLASDRPSDAAVKEWWAFSMMTYAATLPDPEMRKKARARARRIGFEAKKLGDNSNLLQVVLDVPEDGSEPTFSNRKDVDDAMKAAEADFARGDLDLARQGYLQALLLDPGNYEAALFIGDVYFKQNLNGSAGEWFARAAQINPDRETAYRYWGDALWDLGKSAEAREKYILAIVAEPYNRRSLVGLNQWAGRVKVALNWVRLQDKSKVTQEGMQTTITVDTSQPTKDGDFDLATWLAYSMNRALWRREKFAKEFPQEPKYRRTMREEVESLHLMVTVLTEQKDFEKTKKDLDPALVQLIAIDHAGFLEPFALLNRNDNEIAQDYSAYRAAHRDTIYRYFDEFVVPKAPQAVASQ